MPPSVQRPSTTSSHHGTVTGNGRSAPAGSETDPASQKAFAPSSSSSSSSPRISTNTNTSTSTGKNRHNRPSSSSSSTSTSTRPAAHTSGEHHAPSALPEHADTTLPLFNNNNNPYSSFPYGGAGLGGLGGLGYNSMYGGGMYGGGMPPIMGGGGLPWLSGLNQFLFSVQTVIFSLGQAVQIVGMNTHALHQLLDAATAMVDRACTTWNDMRALEQQQQQQQQQSLSYQEEMKRRRRLRALRWAMMVGVSYAAYKIVKRILVSVRAARTRRSTQQQALAAAAATTTTTATSSNARSSVIGGYPLGGYNATLSGATEYGALNNYNHSPTLYNAWNPTGSPYTQDALSYSGRYSGPALGPDGGGAIHPLGGRHY